MALDIIGTINYVTNKQILKKNEIGMKHTFAMITTNTQTKRFRAWCGHVAGGLFRAF